MTEPSHNSQERADTPLLPVLPVKNTVLYPRLFVPLSVGRPRSVAAVEAALASEDKTILVITQKDASVEQPGARDLYTVGTKAVIKKMARSESTMELLVQGLERQFVERMEGEGDYLEAATILIPEPIDEGAENEAIYRSVLELASKALEMAHPQGREINIGQLVSQAENPLQVAWMIGSILSLDVEKEQALLQATTRLEGLRLIHGYLSHEVEVLELRQKIASRAASEMSKEQRDYMLRQQLRAIQEELGEKDPAKAETEALRQQIEEAELPEAVRKEAERELTRLERMPAAAPDHQLTRSYIELIVELPWEKASESTIDLERARQVLDEDHYDLEEVKNRILEHLAVLKLNPEAHAPILCLAGPPGVGKTSLGQSVARALGREFSHMSLGGLHDEAELRGHRRTYIGAMPGRILQAIRRAGVNNPLIMLDEVDKLGRDFRGDPASALLEILDPEQNNQFRDNYLDLPFDLSSVFFITTANALDTIPRPLLDRMEVIRLSGYSEEQKAEIARRYLIPRRLEHAGLTAEQLSIPDAALDHVIRHYSREAGVRELERSLARLARKVALRVADGNDEPVTLQPDNLRELLGPERYLPERARRELPAGVSTGLAWTELGGEVLYIEASLLPSGKELRLTGQLGEVMRESAQAAQSHVWAHADELGVDRGLFQDSAVHIHVPAGAVPKDGPSAGVAMITALASLYTGRPTRSDTAMTGEITLTGLVLPIGGVKEKVLAARRAGIKRVILPRDNEKDLADLPDTVQEELEFVLAERVSEVLLAAIPGVSVASEIKPAVSASVVPPA